MTDFEKALNVLVKGKVRFVVVGGYAIVAHGVSIVTRDLDICYERSRSNLELLAMPSRPSIRPCEALRKAYRSSSTPKLSSGA